MLTYLLITNDPAFAQVAVDAGVGRLFVDLEQQGKAARQGHLDTWISPHTMADVARVKAAVAGRAEVLVRLDPLHAGSTAQIDAAIAAGADLIMQPMVRTVADVARFAALIDGRIRFVPLLETADAVANIAEIADVPGVSELFIGLNDLHLDLGLAFMFEPVANGLIEQAVAALKAARPDMPFGFGGVACVGQGDVPGEMVITEHARLGSSSVILSRTFQKQAAEEGMVLADEVAKLRAVERACEDRDPERIAQDHDVLRAAISRVAERIRAKRAAG